MGVGHGSQNLDRDRPPRRSAVVLGARAGRRARARLGRVRPRRRSTRERLVRYAAAAVVAFVAFGKVALAAVPRLAAAPRPARRRRARPRRAAGCWRAACALTALWFPARYWELVKEFDPLASWLVLARGATLVALCSPVLDCGRPGNPHRLDRARPPRRRVARDERALEPHAARRRLEAHRHPRPHAADRELALDADHRVVRPGHPDVGDRRRARRAARARRRSGRGCASRSRRSRGRRASVASATFSLVASAWTSTTTTGVVARASSTSSSTISHMLCAGSRKSEPSRLTTATGVPSRAATTVSPRPGAAAWRLAGRMTRSRRREVRADLLPAPGVVAERDRVGAGGEQPLGEPRRDADAVRDVLAVDDADVDVELARAARGAGPRPRRGRAARRRRRRRGSACGAGL